MAATFTAKPLELGGNPVKEYATGFGCAVDAKGAAEELFGSSKGLTLSIQGFGNVGLWQPTGLGRWGSR
ncbi:MAG: hypothetical protein NZ954_08605 [Thermofilaceae archaeon]|nr:hypothetical protein [Thermofilaceae archaeon]MCX8179962.1 hypothetical protein [Thermofilaceae archaeon]